MSSNDSRSNCSEIETVKESSKWLKKDFTQATKLLDKGFSYVEHSFKDALQEIKFLEGKYQSTMELLEISQLLVAKQIDSLEYSERRIAQYDIALKQAQKSCYDKDEIIKKQQANIAQTSETYKALGNILTKQKLVLAGHSLEDSRMIVEQQSELPRNENSQLLNQALIADSMEEEEEKSSEGFTINLSSPITHFRIPQQHQIHLQEEQQIIRFDSPIYQQIQHSPPPKEESSEQVGCGVCYQKVDTDQIKVSQNCQHCMCTTCEVDLAFRRSQVNGKNLKTKTCPFCKKPTKFVRLFIN